MTKDKKILIYVVVAMLAVFLVKKKLDPNEEFSQVPTSSPAEESSSPVAADSAPPSSGITSTDSIPNQEPDLTEDPAVGVPKFNDEAKVLLNNFETNHKLKIPEFFQSYTFQKIPTPVDSETDGIIAKDQADGNTMAIFSRKTAPAPEELKKFISQEVAEVLAMRIPAASLEKPEQEKPKPDSGFSDVTVWTVRDKNKIAVITLAKRADNQGVFLNIISGDVDHMQKNEDHLEEELSKFKAN